MLKRDVQQVPRQAEDKQDGAINSILTRIILMLSNRYESTKDLTTWALGE